MKKMILIALASVLLLQLPCAAVAGEFSWENLMRVPARREIAAGNKETGEIAPYVAAWMRTSSAFPVFSEYCIDFKADDLPKGTYCCLANFDLNYSSLLGKYSNVCTEYNGVAGYAGFQRTSAGRLVSIISFWDVFCRDNSGGVTTIRAKQIYPATVSADNSFGGEGTGAHSLIDYTWEKNHWYRMLLQCGTSDTTGNTVITQWVQDLESGTWSCLCGYDLGVKDVTFKGDVAIFLENYDPAFAGEIRTMTVRNIRIRGVNTQSWKSVRSGIFCQNYDHPGSYNYASDNTCFYMISTGVSGKAPNPAQKTLRVRLGDATCPY